MQFYPPNLNYLFWQQVESQPTGIYNKENNQTSSALVAQDFIAFVDRPAGTGITILVNDAIVATATVIDDTGMVRARFPLPYTRNQDTINIVLKDPNGFIVVAESFATSHLALFYDVRAQASEDVDNKIEQINQDNTIPGVSNLLLENKYGVFTGLQQRVDQTTNEYRTQTACLWRSFQFASMEKGLIDSIRCLLGNINIVITPTKTISTNNIFDNPQFGDTNIFDGIVLTRLDNDTPHFYVADIAAAFRTEYAPGGTPLEILGPFPDSPGDDYDSDTVQSFIVHSREAVGSEILVDIGTTELEATASVVGENVLKTPQIGGSEIDQLASTNIAVPVIVRSAIIGGVLELLPANLPVEGVDFTVDRPSGKLTWSGPIKPDDNTTYTVDYNFRLDDALRIVVQQIKPAHISVVLLFQNVTSGLPTSIEV